MSPSRIHCVFALISGTVQSHRRRTVADETHRSFYQRWFPQRGRVRADTVPAALDPSSWEFRAGASSCRPTSGCKHVAGAETDNPYASVHVLPVSSSLVCPKFLGPHQGFSCHRFPSLVERRELCRYTSGSAGVARLAPCPIGFPSWPARYALGVGERCG